MCTFIFPFYCIYCLQHCMMSSLEVYHIFIWFCSLFNISRCIFCFFIYINTIYPLIMLTFYFIIIIIIYLLHHFMIRCILLFILNLVHIYVTILCFFFFCNIACLKLFHMLFYFVLLYFMLFYFTYEYLCFFIESKLNTFFSLFF